MLITDDEFHRYVLYLTRFCVNPLNEFFNGVIMLYLGSLAGIIAQFEK